MSRNDLVHQLAQAGARGDRDALQRTMDLLVAEAMDEGKVSHARRLSSVLEASERSAHVGRRSRVDVDASRLPEGVRQLVSEAPARRMLHELVLAGGVAEAIREFIDEQAQVALLRANSLEPRHTVLLVGPPGNGKTSLAEVIAAELGLAFLTVRYDALVDSYLGETASRLRRLLDFAAATPCLLFFDEFDAIGKERGDPHETGEIKRVVSSLLVQMDALPTTSVVVCATNHPELLDRAVWRRFELKLEVAWPNASQIAEMLRRLERTMGNLGLDETEFVRTMTGRSMSEVEAFALDIRRRLVLSKGALSASQAANATMDRWLRWARLDRGDTAGDDGKINPENKPRGGARKKNRREQEAAVSTQDALPGTGGAP